MEQLGPRPIGPRMLVKVMEERDGIWLPNGSRAFAQRGVVVAVGDGFRLSDGGFVPLEIEIADEVMFMAERTIEVTVGEETLNLVHIEEILLLLSRAPVVS